MKLLELTKKVPYKWFVGFFVEASAVYKDTNLPIDEHCRYKDFFVIDDFILLQFFVL